MIPLWLLAVAILFYVITLIKIHKRMKPAIKWAIALPAICLAILFVTFEIPQSSISLSLRSSIGRLGLFSFFSWQTYLLFHTRKMHI